MPRAAAIGRGGEQPDEEVIRMTSLSESSQALIPGEHSLHARLGKDGVTLQCGRCGSPLADRTIDSNDVESGIVALFKPGLWRLGSHAQRSHTYLEQRALQGDQSAQSRLRAGMAGRDRYANHPQQRGAARLDPVAYRQSREKYVPAGVDWRAGPRTGLLTFKELPA
jgi:hypothetical protein